MAYSVYLVEVRARDIHTGETRNRSFAISAPSETAARDKGYRRMAAAYPVGNYGLQVVKVQRKGPSSPAAEHIEEERQRRLRRTQKTPGRYGSFNE